MPKYRLIYFDVTGRGEVIRMLFSLAGVEFEDKRIVKTSAEWTELKPKTPFGQLPLLEIDDDVTLCQSHTIYRYLAKQFGYAGQSDIEQAQVDMIMDCVIDFFRPIVVGVILTPDEKDKARNLQRYGENVLPGLLTKFEAFLASNCSGSGFFVGKEMTLADIYFIERFTSLELRFGLHVDLKPWPRVTALKDKVLKHPRIAAWKNKT